MQSTGRPQRAPWLASLLIGVAAAGCTTLGDRAQPLVPTQHQVRTGPFVVFTNGPITPDDGVVSHLNSLRVEVEETLGFRVDAGETPIEVYILNDRKAFEHFLAFYYPDLPQRRAFFIAQGPRRVVYTFRGDRLIEDLRHEATHALLNLAIGTIPLWLDEGLAEYFEEFDENGWNREHANRLPQDLRDGWTPNLERLEGLKAVRQMTPRDYREAWAWVHFALKEDSGWRAALLAHLDALKKPADPGTFRARLPVSPGEAARSLKAHVEAIGKTPPRPTEVVASTVRMQDEPAEIEPMVGTSKKRGFFARLFGRSNP